jgi:hypothetical protein
MGLIRQAGYEDVAATIRNAEYDNDLIFALLRLTTAPRAAERTLSSALGMGHPRRTNQNHHPHQLRRMTRNPLRADAPSARADR